MRLGAPPICTLSEAAQSVKHYVLTHNEHMNDRMFVFKSELSEAELKEIEEHLAQGSSNIQFRGYEYRIQRAESDLGEGYVLTPEQS